MNMRMDTISEEDRKEIIQYGIKSGKVFLISTLITIIIGCFFGVFFESIIFWFSFCLLRKYAGGYHADTEKRCYLISFIIVIISLLSIKKIVLDIMWGILTETIILFIIFFLAPIETENHCLDEDEKRKYAIKTKFIILNLYLVFITLLYFNKISIAISVEMANLIVAISLLFGVMKLKSKALKKIPRKRRMNI